MDYFEWIFVLAGLLGAIYIYVTWNNDHFLKHGVPFMKPLPLLGNMMDNVFMRKTFADTVIEKYYAFPNKFMGFFEFRNPTIFLRDLELIKQVTVKDFDHFLDHRLKIDEHSDPLFGRNLFSLKGQKWRDMRSTLSPAFTGSKMRGMFGLMNECAEQLVQYLKEESKKGPLVIEAKELFSRFASDVIATTAFGIKVDSLAERDNNFYKMGKLASTFDSLKALKLFGFTSFPAFMKVLKIKLIDEKAANFFRSMVLDTMNTRDRNGIFRPDMIQLLMQVRKGTLKHEEANNDDDAGFATVEESAVGRVSHKREWEDDDIIAQALLFFIAGSDGMSTVLSFTMHELAVNPNVQRRLQAEIDEARKNNVNLSYETLQKMEYIDMVISESLRKWPPAIAADRVCIKPYAIIDSDTNIEYTIQPGQGVFIPIYAIHHDPELYPDPEAFDPDRFSGERKGNIKPTSYLPFGMGPRNCIGSRFALMEAKSLIFNLLAHFNIKVCSKTQIPLKMSKLQFSVASEKGFWIELKPRK